jgi:hypothetical protein
MFIQRACLVCLLSLAVVASAPAPAFATQVTTQQGKNICRGKAKAGRSGCAWCGKRTCTTVACDEHACDVVVIHAVPPSAATKNDEIDKNPRPPVGHLQPR